MQTTIKVVDKPKLRKPIFIEGLPGIGNVGRVAAGYLISELKMKKLAELYSPHFLPLVILQENSEVSLLKNEFYYYKTKNERDMIVLTGDTQSISPEGHYEVCEKILDFTEKHEISEIITLGGFAQGEMVQEPKVIGAVNNAKMLKKYNKYNIDFGQEHSVGTIVGASGLLLGMAKLKDIDAMCLMGETIGLPMVTDPKAAEKALQVVTKILGLKVDLSKIEKAIQEMEDKIKKTEKIHKNMLKDIPKGKDDIRYIG